MELDTIMHHCTVTTALNLSSLCHVRQGAKSMKLEPTTLYTDSIDVHWLHKLLMNLHVVEKKYIL